MIKRRSQRWGWAGFMLALGVLPHPAGFAADTATSPPPSTSTNTSAGISFLPPSLSVLPLTGSGSIFSSCIGVSQAGSGMGDVATMVQSALGGKASSVVPTGPISISSECAGGGSTEASAVECKVLRTDGKYDPEKLKPYLTGNATALTGFSCRDLKFKAIQGELSCLGKASDSLNSQVRSLQSEFEKQINGDGTLANQGARGYFTQMQDYIGERKAQMDDISKKLKGSDSGEKGLLAIQLEAQGMVKNMPTQIQDLKESQKLMAIQRQALEEQVASRSSGLARKCFETKTQSNYLCDRTSAGTTSVNLKAYLVCTYQAWQQVLPNGNRDNSAITKAKAAGKAGQLSALLDQMLGDMNSNPDLPASADASAATGDAHFRITSAADVENNYGLQLQQFTGTNPSIYSVVMGQFTQCFQQAENDVAAERTTANSKIFIAQAAITRTERQNSKNANDMLTEWSTKFTETMVALTGQHLPLDTSSCVSKNPDGQSACLDELSQKYTALVNGSGKNALAFDMRVSGTKPSPLDRTFKCVGLTGCITALQAQNTAIEKDKTRVEKMKKTQLDQFNASVTSYMGKAATAFSSQSSQLAAMVNGLNTALGSLGVSKAIESKSLSPCDPPEYDTITDDAGATSQGVIKPSANLLKSIGCRMTPPLLDVSGDLFASASSAMADGLTKNQTDLDKAKKDLLDMQGKGAECKGEDKQKAEDLLSSIAKDFQDGICSYNQTKSVCPNAAADPMSSFSQILSELGGKADPDIIASLQTGIKGLCTSTLVPVDMCKADGTLDQHQIDHRLFVKCHSTLSPPEDTNNPKSADLIAAWNLCSGDLNNVAESTCAAYNITKDQNKLNNDRLCNAAQIDANSKGKLAAKILGVSTGTTGSGSQ